MRKLIPVVDLFSGPGGLAEGFAAPRRKGGRPRFKVALSVEKDAVAHRTLRLRTFLRKFSPGPPDEYYECLNGSMSKEPDWAALYREKWEEACDETPCIELGTDAATSLIEERIDEIRDEHGDRTVLLGGPPCQSYSVAGRARNAGNPNYDIDKDDRLSLYKEYAAALTLLQPAVAVMENVKGILSARYNDEPVFDSVMAALQKAGGEGNYRLVSLSSATVGRAWPDGLDPRDFVVRAEQHGVPQRRHRVFVICIRSDVASELPDEMFPRLEADETRVTVGDVVGAMPLLRSRLSRGDGAEAWRGAVEDAHGLVESDLPEMSETQEAKFRHALKLALKSATGTPLPFRDETTTGAAGCKESCPERLRDWLCDENLTRLPNNETRGHIREDIGRYLYAAAFASTFARSPRATDFPSKLAAKHANWDSGNFSDRFRVQLATDPATTITSHISKDGHYFIHPDSRQCRSLTVREAARLQTFPDNYLFHGGRTQQYVQVGNAVPPYLAWRIAEQVANVFAHCDRKSYWSTRQSQQVANGSRRRRTHARGAPIEP